MKELARRMQQPNTKNMQALKRLVRFLRRSPRCLVVHNRQAEQPIVDVFSESDWARCAKTRRSTSSSYVMLVGHLFAASATTQNVVATSSGEAEFYALTKSAKRALGAVAMFADMAKVVRPRLRVGASKAIASRRGVGRVRHLHTQVLWVQEAVARRELTILKVPRVQSRRHGDETLGSVGSLRKTVDDGVWGRTGDLSQSTLPLRKRKRTS